MDLNKQGFYANPKNPSGCLVKNFPPHFTLYVFPEGNVTRINQPVTDIDLNGVDDFSLRLWYYSDERLTYHGNENSTKIDNENYVEVCKELEKHDIKSDFIDKKSSSNDILHINREQVIWLLERLNALGGEVVKVKAAPIQKRDICPECGGTGIVDMEFYKRKCLNPEFHSGE